MHRVNRASKFAKLHRYLLLTALAIVVMITVSVSLFGMHHSNTLAAEQAANNSAKQSQKTTHEIAQQAKDATLQNSTIQPSTAATQTTSSITRPSKPVAKSTTSVVAYKTSPDPRSTTDSSTTPPPANPASFDIAITHSGQVAPGTVISYNATKGERTIYGGDLIINNKAFDFANTPNIGEDDDLQFQAIVPDGATVNLPGLPYNAPTGGFWVSGDSAAAASSFNLTLNPSSSHMAPGMYTIHIITNRSAPTADDYEYDGFLTVDVTN